MNIDIIRAWKDAEYRESLSDSELAMVPEKPVGEIELTDEDLLEVTGAGGHGASTLCQVLSVCINSVIC
jgi:mersacidin/lichenicidin family type 2 lantibiotic